MSRRALFWLVFTVSFALDQATKAWARSAFVEHEAPGFPWPGVFELTLQYNEGIAFGMFQGVAVFLTPIAVAIALGAWLYSHRHPEESAWTHVSMALLTGGALGNLYDRLVLGKVTDMFSFRAINFPVFNVADSCITVAAAILILKWSRELAVRERGKPGPSSESSRSQGSGTETPAKDAS